MLAARDPAWNLQARVRPALVAPGADMHHPRARTKELIVERLPEETLVYDLRRHRAHCLNAALAWVWDRCDGRTSPEELARRLGKPESEEIVRVALSQLSQAGLLETKLSRLETGGRCSRRELVRRLGQAAAVAVPVVVSIHSPAAAAAGSDCVANCQPIIDRCKPCGSNCTKLCRVDGNCVGEGAGC